jgi:hypothetical protein
MQNVLIGILKQAAESCYQNNLLSLEEINQFFMSVTEQEIYHGILCQTDPNKRSLVFIREFENKENSDFKNMEFHNQKLAKRLYIFLISILL